VRLLAVLLASLLIASITAGCGSGTTKVHHSPAPTIRAADVVDRCLAAEKLHVLRSGPGGASLLYAPAVGGVVVLRVPRYAASVWVYESHAAATRMFQQADTELMILGSGNTLAVFAGKYQPTPAQEKQIDACAFGPGVQPVAGPLIDT
jgi:hypothetical protein